MGEHTKNVSFRIYDYSVDLALNEHLTLINGDSGIGKTLIYNYFDRQSYTNKDIKCFNSRYVEKTFKSSKEFRDRLSKIRGALIVIDNADVVLDNDIKEQIVYDKYNTYILFGRNVDNLWITEYNIAALERNDDTKQLRLNFYFKGV